MIQRLSLQVAGALSAIALWFFATDVINREDVILGEMGPLSALAAIGDAVAKGWLIPTILTSLYRLSVGLLIAIAVGVVVGVALGSLRWLELAATPVVQFLRMVSPLSWAPIAIVAFGIGDAPVVFLVAIAAVWPVILATAAGIHALDPRYWLLARTLRATRLEFIRAFVFPGIRAQLTTGIRLALGVAWIVLVPAEMLGVDSGLGYQVLNTRDQFDYSLLAGVMLVIGLVGFLMDLLARKIMR